MIETPWYESYYGILFKTSNGVLTYIRLLKTEVNSEEDVLRILNERFGSVQIIKID